MNKKILGAGVAVAIAGSAIGYKALHTGQLDVSPQQPLQSSIALRDDGVIRLEGVPTPPVAIALKAQGRVICEMPKDSGEWYSIPQIMCPEYKDECVFCR